MLTDAPAQLPPSRVSETDQTSSQSEAEDCQRCKNASVIYITGHRSFWVVPQNVLDKVETSAARLKAAASRETLEQRMSELEKAGLTDLFLPATPRSFLPPAQQSEWDDLVRQNQDMDPQLKKLDEELDQEEEAYDKRLQAIASNQAYYANRQQAKAEWAQARQGLENQKRDIRAEKEKRSDRLAELQDWGFEAARDAGFHVVNGELFSPQQKGISELLSAYLYARTSFEEDEMPNEAETTLFINICRQNRELMEHEWRSKTPDNGKIKHYVAEISKLEGKMRHYTDAVLDLANIGIASPEYSLATGVNDINDGILELSEIRKLEWEIERLTKDMKEHGGIWQTMIGNNGPAPAPALLKFQHKIQTRQEDQEALRCRAKDRAEEMTPPKLFVWHPDEYQARPYKALVRPGVPLREFSRPGGGSDLQHFSLLDVPGGQGYLDSADQPDSRFDIAVSLKTAQKPDEDQALEKLLKDQGATKYPLEPDWFGDEGLFQPEKFFNTIKSEGVLEQYSPEELGAWGAHLETFLFESEAKRHLMHFDDSYTAQFARLVTSGIPGDLGRELQNQMQVEVLTGVSGPSSEPDLTMKNGKAKAEYSLGEARIGANLTYRQGQLDVLSLNLPKPEDAEVISIPYNTEAGSGVLELGRFHCAIDAKCWGFVGARFLMSRNLGIEAVPGEGIQLTGLDKEKREVTGAELEAFGGAQAGLMVKAEMKWSPPQRLRLTEKWRLLGEEIPEWITLGLVRGELVGSGGLGGKGEVTLGMKKGRLVVYVKGRIVAGLGGGGAIGIELAFDTLPMWMRLLQQELHDNGYRRVYWIDDEAFGFMSMLMNLHLSAALSMSFLAAQSYEFVKTVYDDFYESENAGMVAMTISVAVEVANGETELPDDRPSVSLEEYKSWFLGLQPEAIGPMLYHLVAEPVDLDGNDIWDQQTTDEMLKRQQISILQCLEWMAESELVQPESYRGEGPNRIQRQFEESVTRMNSRGTKPLEGSLQFARDNVARLDEFMGRAQAQAQASPFDTERLQKYKKLRRKFSLHLLEQV